MVLKEGVRVENIKKFFTSLRKWLNCLYNGLIILCKGLISLCKGLALFIPTVISIGLVFIIIKKFDEAKTDVQIVELKMDSIIVIIGVAVSVWIGMNVYNLIEKKELEEIKNKINTINNEQNAKIIEITGTYEENIRKLKSEIKNIGTVDCTIQILKTNLEDKKTEDINALVRNAINKYCARNEDLIIFLDDKIVKDEEKETVLIKWDLRSNQELSKPGHLERIKAEIRSSIYSAYTKEVEIKVLQYLST